ncbi:GtrA family protein [Nocardia altamirensis]|uniref:GtrA family protein n=1 Tax=Nocardia altamirensis TaxID=472158 RepID=UPI000AB09064|nr:GtrA family protein [Nocardia altamirensis]
MDYDDDRGKVSAGGDEAVVVRAMRASGDSNGSSPSAEGAARQTPDGPGRLAVTGDAMSGGVGALGAVEPAKAGPLLRLVRRQEVAFAGVGAFNTAMGIGMTVVWLAVLGDNVPPSVAVAAAYAVSIVVAFVLHRTLVFRVRGHLIRDFLRFVAVNSGGLLLNMLLLELAVSVWHFPDKPAAVVVMGLVAVASYFGHRHISFRRRPAVEADDAVG